MSVFNVIYLFPLLVHKSVSAKAAPDAPDSPCKLYVFLHQGDPLGVYSAQLRVLKQMYHEGLCGFLQRLDGLALPSKLFARRTTIQSNFSNLSSIKKTRPVGGRPKGGKEGLGGFPSAALTRRINGSFSSKSFVLAWYCLISRNATVPGRYRRRCLVGSGSPAEELGVSRRRFGVGEGIERVLGF
jgi:hypothetical protein